MVDGATRKTGILTIHVYLAYIYSCSFHPLTLGAMEPRYTLPILSRMN